MNAHPEPLTLPPAPSRLPRPRAGLLIAVLLLSFVLGLAWLVAGQWQSESSRAALEDLHARSTRLHHLDTLLLQMLDAESSVRGYLLTQNPVYLTPYQDGQAELERTLAALRADAWTDDGQRETVDHLALLVDMRWSLLTQAIERGVPPGADQPDGGTGKQVTDDLRTRILALRAATQAEIDATQDGAFARFADARTMNRVLGASVLALLLVLVLVLYRQDRLRERMAQLLRSENERLHTEVAHRTQELSSLATYLTNAREAEQARLARELHDELGQSITAVRSIAGAILQRSAEQPGIHGSAQAILAMTGHMQDGVHAILQRLRRDAPAAHERVEDTLQAYCALWASHHGDIRVDCTIEALGEQVTDALGLTILRMVQESLTNVARHAHATRVEVRLGVRNDEIEVEVIDNGRGLGENPAPGRHGLVGMRERIESVHGRLRIDAGTNRGTQLVARVPCVAHDDA